MKKSVFKISLFLLISCLPFAMSAGGNKKKAKKTKQQILEEAVKATRNKNRQKHREQDERKRVKEKEKEKEKRKQLTIGKLMSQIGYKYTPSDDHDNNNELRSTIASE